MRSTLSWVCALAAALAGCHGVGCEEKVRRAQSGLAEVVFLRDELVRTRDGVPSSIRLTYGVRVPGGDYLLTPFMMPEDPFGPQEPVTFLPQESLSVGRNVKRRLESGRVHEITHVMVPVFGGVNCLPPQPPAAPAQRFRIQIYDTPLHRKQRPLTALPLTEQRYDPAELYQGQRASGRKVCGSGVQSGGDAVVR